MWTLKINDIVIDFFIFKIIISCNWVRLIRNHLFKKIKIGEQFIEKPSNQLITVVSIGHGHESKITYNVLMQTSDNSSSWNDELTENYLLTLDKTK